MTHKAKLKVGFAGTPAFAVPALQRLIDCSLVNLACVYTQPDRASGRGRRVTQSPVKQLAANHGIPVFQPANFKQHEEIESFAEHALDVFVVAAYGLILPSGVLAATKYPINIHASLLPRWRGAAPMQRAIMAGDDETGITIIRITEKLDAGPMWNKITCPITAEETAGTLHDKLAIVGAQAIGAALESIVTGTVVETAQDNSKATYAEKITAADRELDWQQSAELLVRRIRALNPSPHAVAHFADMQCKIFSAVAIPQVTRGEPGTIAFADGKGLGIYCSDGIVNIQELQPPGKKAMSSSAFLNGYGDRLNTQAS